MLTLKNWSKITTFLLLNLALLQQKQIKYTLTNILNSKNLKKGEYGYQSVFYCWL